MSTVNVDDGLEDVRWIRGLGRGISRGVLRSSSKPEKVSTSCHRRGTEIWSPAFYTAAPKCVCVRRLVNVDDGLEDIHGLGARNCPRCPSLFSQTCKRVYSLPSERDGDLVACFLHSSAQMCFVSGAWPTPATYNRPFCEHCLPWSRARRYIGMCSGCVCSLGDVYWLAQAYWLCCASLLFTPGNTRYPCLASEAKLPVCST